jgi:hypothetical protein
MVRNIGLVFFMNIGRLPRFPGDPVRVAIDKGPAGRQAAGKVSGIKCKPGFNLGIGPNALGNAAAIILIFIVVLCIFIFVL